MCQIIYKPTTKTFNFAYLDKAQKFNKDGYGIMWYEDKTAKSYTTLDYTSFKLVMKALESKSCVVHLRNTSAGLTNLDNCHPFIVPTGYMMHNGTILTLKDYKDKDSDTAKLADLICDTVYDKISDISPLLQCIVGNTINRLVFLEDSGEVTIINEDLGIWEDGIWYSNDYHLQDKPDVWCKEDYCYDKTKTKVFVYGTLKRGYGNNHLLKFATFLGKATTADNWSMIGEGNSFPYVLHTDDILGMQITGEVYEVDSWTLKSLDRLEGIPHHYKHEKVEVFYDDNVVEEVTMYVKAKVTKEDLLATPIKSF